MKTHSGDIVENKIIHQLFLKSEISWGVSDFSKAIGPMIDMVFISSYIGVNGVTVLGFISPLTMFFEVIGSAVANGARNMVSSMIGAGKLDDANRVFSDSLIMSGGLSILLALLSFVFCPGLARIPYRVPAGQSARFLSNCALTPTN
jgi:Na+-driven multidrug efflux pump